MSNSGWDGSPVPSSWSATPGGSGGPGNPGSGGPPGGGHPPGSPGGGPPGGEAPPPPPATFTPPPPPPPPELPERDGPAWEQRKDLGALFSTVGAVLFNPGETFKNMVRDRGLGGPILYVLILGTICGWIGELWSFLLSSVFENMFGGGLGNLGQFGDNASWALDPATQHILAVVLMPAFVLIGFLVISGIFHLFLLLVGGARQPFETTARVVAYTNGSTALFNLIPFCGGFIAVIWNIVVWIIGLSEAHETSVGKAVAAVLLPVALCCFCAIAIVIFFAAAISGMMGNM